MLTSGLTNTPLTKTLLIYTIASSIALSILDIKHLAQIYVSPHFWPYAQFWRALVWHVAGFTNSTEALFAAMLVYHLRVVERAWGKRKMVTFLLTTLPYTTLLPPLLLALIVRPLSLNTLNYLPSGPTAMIFALLAQYYAMIPHTFRFRIGTTSSPSSSSSTTTTTTPATANDDTTATNQPSSTSTPKPSPPSLTLLLSDKTTTYLVAAQLALSQFPAMLLPSAVGWIVGMAWRAELLPGLSPASHGFRVPAWMVGERERRSGPASSAAGGGGGASAAERERFEDLRRRLEGEVAASASGMENGGGQRRRGAGSGIMERFRGAW
ncbi:uncharacterized protein N7473_002349 [Penicillium subrubescens]|uniref:DSC E3 ubiquitin ligase complex subunit 2 n=1 Tax=Penicillium subrubescens TaxID=1316194 RepID=A0A1Q5SXT6_9EURO|nr:uncharacterized protein N7473_002349 [Penicillium subrubescens]KAJ5905433.1 hypothetical protein N7473_002349 [Penicillium subrubescens]OKO92804.1 DSC E3 ubiquitin ligase complex subunit 2 [Penicillium subrubescens]